MKKNKRKARNRSSDNTPSGPRSPLGSAITKMIRLPLLPVAPAGAITGALLATDGVIDNRLVAPAAAASCVYVFATAFNDLMDSKSDANKLGSPGRTNPLVKGEIPVKLAWSIAAISLLAALALAISPAVNMIAVIAAIALSGSYSLFLKKFPPIGLIALGAAAAAISMTGLCGDSTRQWIVLPCVTGYLTTITMAFAWAWERRRPALWGNNWLILGLLCSALLPGISKLNEHFGLVYAPADAVVSNTLICAGLFMPIMLVVFFRTQPIRRGTMLRFVGLLWLMPVWMSLIGANIQGNALFLPGMGLLLTVVFIQLTLWLGSQPDPRG